MTKAAHPTLRFQPLRRVRDAEAQDAIAALIAFLLCKEPRRRHRTPDSTRKFNAAVQAVVANLLRPDVLACRAMLAIPRGHDTLQGGPARYRPLAYGQHFLDAVDLIEAHGVIVTVTAGFNVRQFQRSQMTTIRPAVAKLAQHVPLAPIDEDAFHFLDPPELIVLKDRKSKKPLDYSETVDTRRWRREMETINVALRAAPATLLGDVPTDDDGYRPSAEDRALRRIFSGDWERGGRLYGGFWTNMARQDRYRCIRIAGEPVANVDLQQCHLRLAYADAHAPLPDDGTGDFYVAGEGEREGWKRITNALFNREKVRNAWPARTPQERKEMAALFPPGARPADVIEAVRKKHAPIAHLFDCGIGLRFQRREADILVAALLRLIDEGIPALPLHDSVIVAASQAEAAKAILEAEAKKHAGVPVPAKIETGP